MIINKDYKKYLNIFLDIIEEKSLKSQLFTNDFYYNMAKTSGKTLINIELLINEYLKDNSDFLNDGDKIVSLFGVLQGLFVGIDSIYTIGRATGLNKLMININQNEALRSIKHIRNDVVGHPTFRYYDDKSIGYCALDLDNIEFSKVKYHVYTSKNKKLHVEERNVDIKDSITNYFDEIVEILKRTIQYFDILKTHQKSNISVIVNELGLRFSKGKSDIILLEKIKNDYNQLFDFSANTNNRVIWRLNLISYLFNYENKNEYTEFLTFQEIYKLYSLLYNFEKKIDNSLKYKFIRFNHNKEFKYLKAKMGRLKKDNFNFSILHDPKHPLYVSNINILIEEFKDDENCKNLISWIVEQVNKFDMKMLYLIGSELKK